MLIDDRYRKLTINLIVDRHARLMIIRFNRQPLLRLKFAWHQFVNARARSKAVAGRRGAANTVLLKPNVIIRCVGMRRVCKCFVSVLFFLLTFCPGLHSRQDSTFYGVNLLFFAVAVRFDKTERNFKDTRWKSTLRMFRILIAGLNENSIATCTNAVSRFRHCFHKCTAAGACTPVLCLLQAKRISPITSFRPFRFSIFQILYLTRFYVLSCDRTRKRHTYRATFRVRWRVVADDDYSRVRLNVKNKRNAAAHARKKLNGKIDRTRIIKISMEEWIQVSIPECENNIRNRNNSNRRSNDV